MLKDFLKISMILAEIFEQVYNKNIELGFKKANKGNKKSRNHQIPGLLLL